MERIDPNSASGRYRRILHYFPEWMHDSALIQRWADAISKEVSSRLADDMDIVAVRSKPLSLDDDLLIEFWEDALGFSHSDERDHTLRRRRIFEKIVRRVRFRRADIASLVSLFLSGDSTFVRERSDDTNVISVLDANGFMVGDDIWVGADNVRIEALLPNDRFRLSRSISVYPFEVVSNSYVNIIEAPASYLFYVDIGGQRDIEDSALLQAALNESKPAHLDYRIRTSSILYDDFKPTEDAQTGTYDEASIQYDGFGDLFTSQTPLTG